MKRLAVLFATTALTAVIAAGYSGGRKETAAKATRETETTATVEATIAAETKTAETAEEAAEAAAKVDGENYDTRDASKGNTRNQGEIGEDELLMISFGIGYNDSERLTVGVTEDAIEEAFPDFAVKRGSTDQIIIDHVKSWDDVAIDNVDEALDRAKKNNVRNLMIQPTHLMSGFEYTDLVNGVVEYSDAFEEVAIGKPFLTTNNDFRVMMKAITGAAARYDDGETAICFMRHGTEAGSNQVYAEMQDMFTGAGYRNYYVGTVEAVPGLDDILTAAEERSYKKIVLGPLMIVASDHTSNDMAGDEEGSWKTTFEDASYEVTCLVNRLGELEVIEQLFVEHTQAAVDSLTE